MNTLLQVLIVDDHRMFREGVRSRLEQEPDIQVVGEASSGQEAFALVEQTNPTIVTLDIRLPDTSGIEVARLLRQQHPELKIVILSAYDFDQYIASKLMRTYSTRRAVFREREPDELTVRELEVVELMGHGSRNIEIARRLLISVRTVEAHVSNIMAKLGAQSRTEAVQIAIEEGLIK